MNHAKVYEFDPGQQIREILLVGLGGTGAQIARKLARLIYHMKQQHMDVPSIVFIDHDTVSQSNIGRQLFTEAEIGENKARVTARRFNMAMGLNIEARPRMLRPHDFKGRYDPNTSHYNNDTRTQLLIGAVDNAAARQIIHDQADRLVAWIDAGNHEFGGQVIIGNSTKPMRTNRKLTYRPNGDRQYKWLPAPSLIMPDLLTPEETEISCAELVEQNRQDLLVNDWMADVAAGYAKALLLRQPIYSFMTYVDTRRMNVRSIPLTCANLRSRMELAKQ